VELISTIVVAFGSAVIGSVVGPLLALRFTHKNEQKTFIRDQRRESYVAFAIFVEKLQRSVDRSRALSEQKFDLGMLDDLEFSRVAIDVYGSRPVRVWAYRCRITFDSLAASITGGRFEAAEVTRGKLHEAREQLLAHIRDELKVTGHDGKDPNLEWHNPSGFDELSAAPITDADHERWLLTVPEEAAKRAGSKTVELHQTISRSILPQAPTEK
jgi:hypothetical protein